MRFAQCFGFAFVLLVGPRFYFGVAAEAGYIQVAPNGNACGKNGKQGRRCLIDLGDNVPKVDCENLCNSSTACIGYSHAIILGKCLLYRREQICTKMFKYIDGEIITSIYELEGYANSHYSGCYAKATTSTSTTTTYSNESTSATTTSTRSSATSTDQPTHASARSTTQSTQDTTIDITTATPNTTSTEFKGDQHLSTPEPNKNIVSTIVGIGVALAVVIGAIMSGIIIFKKKKSNAQNQTTNEARYEDDDGYDYADNLVEDTYDNPIFEKDVVTAGGTRGTPETDRCLRNNQNAILKSVRNPYYGVDDTGVDSSSSGDSCIAEVKNVKVVENEYYAEEDNVTNEQGDNQEVTLKTVENPYYGIDTIEIDSDRREDHGNVEIMNIKVTDNPYYA